MAQAVLRGQTRGLPLHHPPLIRFRDAPSPIESIAAYLLGVHAEAIRRGYSFDATMPTQSMPAVTIDFQELAGVLEPLIRRIVREELAQVAIKRPDVFYLTSDSPLHDDMVEILNRKGQGATRLYSHAEIWNE